MATATAHSTSGPRARVSARTVGWVLTALVSAFLLFDGVSHITRPAAVTEYAAEHGLTDSMMVTIGIVMLACLALYLVPATAILGAVLLTGYLGGAVWENMRSEAPIASTVLFPIYVGVVVWGALALRDARIRHLVGRSPRR
ncbi:DoxX family protein [Rhodococcus sp. HNM0569]|uniref:DoxX family protein n=1 Tax=Rhodococcus sp. HNM0569 TaxID=2716340 RepID=UPI00146F7CAB|nr:DoxX family protein [Rhodococcus sp. HNM0569]NLU83342.1 DoxX family protein [Rhodococcus sp. HNM0569]